LAGYSKLEIGLMNCVYMALDDFDAVLKAMFKPRGESLRINEAEKLGRVAYKALDLEADFLAAVEAMRHCLTIRNQYSHWIWWDDNSGMLAFANVEDIAKIENRVDNLGQQGLSRATPGRRPPGTRKHSPGLPPKWPNTSNPFAHSGVASASNRPSGVRLTRSRVGYIRRRCTSSTRHSSARPFGLGNRPSRSW